MAGLRAAETLRQEGYDGRLTLVGSEPHLPYDRPPLSKEILRGEWDASRTSLRKEGYEALDLDLRLGLGATALDPSSKRVSVGGDEIAYDGVVIATGAVPRRLRGAAELEGVHVLRTLDDALAIRAALERGPRVTVVGAGFIGAEVAASARSLGLDVTVVEAQDVPLAHAIGAAMGKVCADLHRSHGVDLRCGVGVSELRGDGRVEAVALTDGSSVDTDLVVVGIGVSPVTNWLESSGLRLDDGVCCDSTCATDAPGVVAAGDVARWHNPLFDEVMRVEHWTNAVEQGVAAAERLLHGAAAKPYSPVPMFWSDQYGIKIQFAGRARPDDEIRVVHGDTKDSRFVALYGREGKLTGALAMRSARRLMRYSEMIAERASWEDAVAPPAE